MNIETKACGKLYLLGEFAVTAGAKAILLPIKCFVTVSISDAKESESKDPLLKLTSMATTIAEKYLTEKGIAIKPYKLEIKNELIDQKSGVKYGLGSSAAITVAVMDAVLKFHGISETPLHLFKLAALSNLQVQKTGSMGDVATAIMKKPIVYRTFDKEQIKAMMERKALLSEIINAKWNQLLIEPLLLPDNFYFLIGWTKELASTPDILLKFNAFKKENPESFETFLKESDDIVNSFIEGLKTNQVSLCEQSIRDFKLELQVLQKLSGIEIATPKLKELIRIAEGLNVVAKTSGAGNGDCGIAMTSDKSIADKIKRLWQNAGILPLNFGVLK